MRILMLSPYIPWPLNGGPPIRIYYVLRELVRHGHEVVLLAGHDGPSLPATHLLHTLCREIATYQPPSSARSGVPFVSALRSLASPLPYVAAKFGARYIQESIQRLAEKHEFDLIWANFAFMAYAVPPELCGSTPLVLDEHESEGLLWRQYLRHGSLAKRAFAVVNLIKLPAFQRRLMSQVAAVLSNSEREADFTRRYAPPGVQVWAVPNGVDTEVFAPPQLDGNRRNAILLCSGLAVYRNRAAALWFARRMFPQVRREVPDAEFWIVGSNPNREIWRLAESPGIHVTGAVEDVRPYYAMAKVAVAPYRYGEGTKIKVVEAMACGTPMVSTSIGCQGLEVMDGRHLLIADNETDFSRRVIELLRDPEQGQAMATAARALAVEKYSWQGLISALEPKLQELARRTSPRENAGFQSVTVNG
jgi:glycosyltransferase involved in cell wall biosynthesis